MSNKNMNKHGTITFLDGTKFNLNDELKKIKDQLTNVLNSSRQLTNSNIDPTTFSQISKRNNNNNSNNSNNNNNCYYGYYGYYGIVRDEVIFCTCQVSTNLNYCTCD